MPGMSRFRFVVLTLLWGCGAQVSQAKMAVAKDTDIVPRADALNVMPNAICKQLQACNKFGPDGKYATLDDCLTLERAKWSEVWSEERCGGSHGAVAGKVRECENRASHWACSGNLFDFGSLVTQCSAADVCK